MESFRKRPFMYQHDCALAHSETSAEEGLYKLRVKALHGSDFHHIKKLWAPWKF